MVDGYGFGAEGNWKTAAFDTIQEAAKIMAKVKQVSYKPIAANMAVYKKLYAEYKALHDYFGRGENDVMKHLKEIKKEAKA